MNFHCLLGWAQAAFSGSDIETSKNDRHDFFAARRPLLTRDGQTLFIEFMLEMNKGVTLQLVFNDLLFNIATDTSNGLLNWANAEVKLSKGVIALGIPNDTQDFDTHLGYFDFIKKYNDYQSKFNEALSGSAFAFNAFWHDKLEATFADLDSKASGNFGIEWLTNYDSALSRHLQQAGGVELLELVMNCERFISEVIEGVDGVPYLCTSLQKTYGKDEAKIILERLIQHLN
ncbi:MAG: hypothetical protein CBC55_02540 [Gammaproteobacteria bacterium TMED95]|nr:MAG: hypothetical protein CBC55_02540 [Gammaproteobacteria bacterium TMED95]|tara:strand:+ start:333 stop:1025 length:693 start_codon:yes stop_codon:yes gene_type:complete